MENIVEESKEVEEGKDVLEIEESMLALPSNKDVAPIRETPPEAGTSKAMEMPEVNARKVVKVEKAMNIPELGARKVEEIAEGGASKAVEIPEGGADNVVEILESVASQAVKIPEGGANNVVEIPEISTGKVVDGVVMIDKKRMDATEIPSTTEAPAPIRSLSPSIAQRMCANQVIGTLAAALKELLENSLDAGATSIHLRLKEYGMDEIEVLDNGHGVKEADFENLAKSHTTSKLVKFEDLDSVSTFGFRGEALHSLCQLCNGICITTMHSSSSTAHQLEYDAIGSLISKKPCLGLVGTKVVLQKIFAVLPVRQKVFVTNHKQEYSKALHLIHAYCLVAENVRVRVSHQASSRKKADILIQTQGGDMFENMILVFGSNIVKDLVQVPSLATQPNEKPGTPKFLVKGYVSSCSHGCGRSAPDKQFFFLNGRPCELPKVQKLVNMVYRQYNKKQYPVVVMNVITQASGNVDFNLDPDKRKVVLKGEGALIRQLMCSLTALFENIIWNRPLDLSRMTESASSASSSSPKLTQFCKLTKSTEDAASTSSLHSTPPHHVPENEGAMDCVSVPQVEQTAPGTKTLSRFEWLKAREAQASAMTQQEEPAEKYRKLDIYRRKHHMAVNFEKACKLTPIPESYLEQAALDSPTLGSLTMSATVELEEASAGPCSQASCSSVDPGQGTSAGVAGWEEDMEIEETEIKPIQTASTLPPTPYVEPWWLHHTFSHKKCLSRQEVTLECTLEGLKSDLSNCEDSPVITEPDYSAFTVPITGSACEAEKELSRQITKEKFLDMVIVGQFNMAFIVTQLEDHIFIIDQHAADEKYNYEMLLKDAMTDTRSQRLIVPLVLNLNLTQEILFLEYAQVFRDAGFLFTIDNEAEVSKKVRITAVPTFLHEEFQIADIIDMLSQLQETPYIKPQPSRMKSLLASRACRSSVMVGHTLDMAAMRRLVDNMATMEHPWNCPHGRPTMRHLTGFTWELVDD